MMNHSTLTSQSRRQPKQGRSKALVDAICESCLKIINAGCGEELSVSLIIKTAGVTKSSFYQYFPNVDTAIGHALAHYDRGYDEDDFFLNQQLREKLTELSFTDSIEFIVNAACDRHARLLKKYGDTYRRFHRNFAKKPDIDNKFDSSSVNAELSEFLQCLFEGNKPSIGTCSVESIVFLMTIAIAEFTGKAVDSQPWLLEEESFRETLKCFLVSYFH